MEGTGVEEDEATMYMGQEDTRGSGRRGKVEDGGGGLEGRETLFLKSRHSKEDEAGEAASELQG